MDIALQMTLDSVLIQRSKNPGDSASGEEKETGRRLRKEARLRKRKAVAAHLYQLTEKMNKHYLNAFMRILTASKDLQNSSL